MTLNFDSVLFDSAVNRCEFLTRAQALEFVTRGFVVIKRAFSTQIAERICTHAWSEFKRTHGIEQHERNSWRKQSNGYIRTNAHGLRIKFQQEAPDAWFAQTDILGGKSRLPADGRELSMSGGVIGNFGVDGDPSWEPPRPRQDGWHKDGWHFRHFLDSPEQGLLTVPIFTEILPQSGGTFLALDSIAPVARLLSQRPQGFHADGTQGSGYLIPYLVEQCTEFIELTGEPGDLAILHPYMLHRRTVNPTDRPRFIANLAIVTKEPMCFARRPDDSYSLVELAVLHALKKDRIDFDASEPRQGYIPGPFRSPEDKHVQRKTLLKEMQTMAELGVITPAWAEQCGYMSNDIRAASG